VGEGEQTDVVVVGAGLAGLTAARRVARAGLGALVLEARDRVGGRLLNEPIGAGRVVEVGGQWIGPTQHRIAALAAALGVETFPTYTAGENVLELGGRLRRYRGTIPRLGPAVLLDFAQAQWRLDRMAGTVPLEAPWRARRARVWDAQTFATWLRRNTRTRTARTFLSNVTEAVWAMQPEDVSLLHVLFYIHSGGGLDRLLASEGGAQQDRFVGGSQTVTLRLAAELGDAVRLGRPVHRIEHAGDGVRVHAGGLVAAGRRAIVALPPTLTTRVAYDPPLPGHRDQMAQRMPQGTVIKCMAVYSEPFWRADGLSGQATSDVGPVKVTFDNSPPDGSPGVLLGFLEGRAARELGRGPAEERRRAVIDCLARLFGPRAAAPERYLERAWAEEEWTRGCYGCSFPPGGWTGFGRALRAPIGPLHWAGAETATVWSGYMDGAVQSGERAAGEVVAALAASRS
jgi:monoamine oxidase